MENASKALIIAGAILLSILIIGLGMFIYNQAANAIGNTGIDAQQVAAYNSKFLQYEGVQTGAKAKQLCRDITSHNLTTAEDSTQFINVQADDATEVTTNGAGDDDTAATFNTAINTFRNGLKAGKSYTISFGYDPQTGYIIAVGITEQKSGS